ncbi:MAG: FAD-dependent thymidylate synthase [Pirellulaceae bacterium]|nr:FAD-dependent thymidylate synthase [Pirellulaceae bacterium]
MQVTCVGIKPTRALLEAGSPALTPELLAACGARYSRNGEGLSAILSKVDAANEDAAVDSIFRMVDYGHQSIADMVPVAMFIDRISLWLALRIWLASPTAGGQESSTRYIQLDPSATVSDAQNIDDRGLRESYTDSLRQGFAAYSQARECWNQMAQREPGLLRLPQSLIESSEPKDKRKVDRICRNFAFDRARYYLPMSSMTNVMLLMSARGWVSLIKQLASEQLSECRQLADRLREELARVAPRLIRHARLDESYASGAAQEFARSVEIARQSSRDQLEHSAASEPFLNVMLPARTTEADLVRAVQHHRGRYDFIGSELQSTSVRFGWQAIPIAEIRDLNRHRTGSKYFTLAPVGTYLADDEVERIHASHPQLSDLCQRLTALRPAGIAATQLAYDQLVAGNPAYLYWLPMGAQCFYEHTTTANHFLYQAELRTGLGSHYQYAARMTEVLDLWHQQFPATAAYVKAGTAEPE